MTNIVVVRPAPAKIIRVGVQGPTGATGPAGPQGDPGDDNPAVAVPLSTGIVTGGALSINALDNTKLDIAAGVGLVVDNSVYPNTYEVVEWAAKTAVTITNLATKPATDIAIDSNGNVIQQDSYTTAELRDYIFLGGVDHSGNTIINNTFSVQVPSYGVGLAVRDLARAIGDINISGNEVSANGANLKINKAAGSTFSFGRNSAVSSDDPHTITQGAQTPVTFRYVYNNGSGTALFGSSVTDINPNSYDGGDGSLVTLGNNKWSIQRVIMFSNSANVFVQYGTTEYSNKADAVAALAASQFPALVGIKTALTIGFIIVKKGSTNLSSTAQAEFIEASRFGGVGITGSGFTEWGSIAGTLSDQTDLQAALDGKVDENVAIVGATKTKITYDSKGLVTAGADATAADVGAEPAIAGGTTSQYWRGDKSWRDFFTDVRAATLTGLSLVTSQVIAATDTVLQALGYLQAQITAIGTANSTAVKTALNASGDAPIYACRAWVNYNQTTGGVIRGFGNVSSVTDNSPGLSTVNFTTAMPDVNYSPVVTGDYQLGTGANGIFAPQYSALNTGTLQIVTSNSAGGLLDFDYVFVAVFR